MTDRYGPRSAGGSDPLDNRTRRFLKLLVAREGTRRYGARPGDPLYRRPDEDGRLDNESQFLDGQDLKDFNKKVLSKLTPDEVRSLDGRSKIVPKFNFIEMLCEPTGRSLGGHYHFQKQMHSIADFVKGVLNQRGLANFEGAEYDKDNPKK